MFANMFEGFLNVRMDGNANIFEGFFGVRMDGNANIVEWVFSCPHGWECEYF